MKSFCVVKNTFDDYKIVIDVLKNMVGNHLDTIEVGKYIVVKYEYDNQSDVKAVFMSMADEMMINVTGYISTVDSNRADEEIDLAITLLDTVRTSGIFNMHELLLEANILDRKRVLNFILDGTGIDSDFIVEFLKFDLNVSKASKAMFIHRNTMNYKLDRLYELSGFDLKVFTDAYILYNLIVGK